MDSPKYKVKSKNVFFALSLLVLISAVLLCNKESAFAKYLSFISDEISINARPAVYISEIEALPEEESLDSSLYEKTAFSSSAELSKDSIDSLKSYRITISSNSENDYYFRKIIKSYYSNENIEAEITWPEDNSSGKVEALSSAAFTLTFKYSDEYKSSCAVELPMELNNKLNFNVEFVFKYTKLSFNLNGGQGEVPDNLILNPASLDTTSLSTDNPAKTGYLFQGWYDSPLYSEGTQSFDVLQQPKTEVLRTLVNDKSHVRLYAGWKPIEYKLVYHLPSFPVEYQPVEYIEADGSQQSLSLNINITTNDLKVETKYRYNALTYYGTIFGCQDNINNLLLRLNGNSNSLTFFAGETPFHNVGSIVLGQDYEGTFSASDGKYEAIINDATYSGTYTPTRPNNISLTIFGSSAGLPSASRIYYFRLYMDGKLVRDMVPCYQKASGVIGMYDLENDAFYPVSGKGFSYGDEITYDNLQCELLKYDEECTIDSSLYTVPESSVFEGWNTSRDGTGQHFLPNEVVSNLTTIDGECINLYPIVSQKVYVSFYRDRSEYCDSLAAPVLCSNQNVVFEGWQDSSGTLYFNAEGERTKDISADLRLYPKYSFISGYTPVEYIQSNGTQYINTGIVYDTADIALETKFKYNSVYQYSTLFGCQGTENLILRYQDNAMMLFHAKANCKINSDLLTDTLYDAVIEASNGEIVSQVNSYKSAVMYSSSNLNRRELYLFASNTGSISFKSSSQMYYFRYYKNNEIVLDMVPCVRDSDGRAGMYDLISGNFFTNPGSDNFAYPQVE